MTELNGTLDGIGLAPLVSFPTGLGKSGRLTIADGPMAGEIFLEAGHVIGAVLAAAIPSLAAVPTLVVEESGTEDEIGLDRDTLRLLMQIDGRRSVADLARERGLLRTLKQLARLSQLKLARIEAANGPSPARPEWQSQPYAA